MKGFHTIDFGENEEHAFVSYAELFRLIAVHDDLANELMDQPA
jgi:hypothetical protein